LGSRRFERVAFTAGAEATPSRSNSAVFFGKPVSVCTANQRLPTLDTCGRYLDGNEASFNTLDGQNSAFRLWDFSTFATPDAAVKASTAVA
jgi:hypothetical protein